jgi:hypothetical protein
MATKEKTEVAEVKKTVNLPAGFSAEDLMADAQDNEAMGTEDVALPYIYILQTNSPQVNPGLPDYVDGAVASMFYNNVSQEVFEGRNQGILVVPCAYERKYVEWTPRESGGGFVRDYDISSDIMSKTTPNDKGKAQLPNGNLIVETAYQYCLWMNPETGDWGQCVISLSSTALKANRKWNNDIVTSKIPGTDAQAPRFLFPYQVKTYLESKNNNSWWAYKIEKVDEPVMPEVYKMAKEFATLVRQGLVNRAAEPGAAPKTDEDIPF